MRLVAFLGWVFIVSTASTAAAQRGPDEPEEEALEEELPTPPARRRAGEESPMRRLLAILRAEPTVRTVQREALRFYDLEPERVRGLVEAAHLKGLMPSLEGGYTGEFGSNYEATRDGLYPILPSPDVNPNPFNYRTRQQGETAGNTFYVRAVFSLDRLVFNSEALDARSLNGLGENLMREVTSLYYSRHRLIASLLLDPPGSELEVFQELMRLDEMTATLDGLTGGHFSERAWQWSEAAGFESFLP